MTNVWYVILYIIYLILLAIVLYALASHSDVSISPYFWFVIVALLIFGCGAILGYFTAYGWIWWTYIILHLIGFGLLLTGIVLAILDTNVSISPWILMLLMIICSVIFNMVYQLDGGIIALWFFAILTVILAIVGLILIAFYFTLPWWFWLVIGFAVLIEFVAIAIVFWDYYYRPVAAGVAVVQRPASPLIIGDKQFIATPVERSCYPSKCSPCAQPKRDLCELQPNPCATETLYRLSEIPTVKTEVVQVAQPQVQVRIKEPQQQQKPEKIQVNIQGPPEVKYEPVPESLYYPPAVYQQPFNQPIYPQPIMAQPIYPQPIYAQEGIYPAGFTVNQFGQPLPPQPIQPNYQPQQLANVVYRQT